MYKTSALSAKELLEIVRQYYPPGLWDTDPNYMTSKEILRLNELQEQASRENGKWLTLLDNLKSTLPDCEIEDWTYLRHDACYRCRIYMPGAGPAELESRAAVACVSIIAPVYLLYVSHQQHIAGRHLEPVIYYEPTDEARAYWRVVAEQIETIFGYSGIGYETGTIRVPDVVVGNVPMDEVTLLDCLFTDDRW